MLGGPADVPQHRDRGPQAGRRVRRPARVGARATATSASATSTSTRSAPRWRSSTTTTSASTAATSFVKGTNQFMAPEIVRDEALPVDGHRSVLAGRLPLHPLHAGPSAGGEAVPSRATRGPQSDHVSEHKLLLRNYGFEPLFVFDPRRRRPTGRRPRARSSSTGRSSRASSATCSPGPSPTGSTDASLSGRITGSVWRRALLRLADIHATCSCHAAIFFDPDEPDRPCWRCGEVPPPQPLLRLPGRTVVLSEGAVITSDHLRRDRAYDESVAVVEAHPSQPGAVVLRNLSSDHLDGRARGGGGQVGGAGPAAGRPADAHRLRVRRGDHRRPGLTRLRPPGARRPRPGTGRGTAAAAPRARSASPRRSSGW